MSYIGPSLFVMKTLFLPLALAGSLAAAAPARGDDIATPQDSHYNVIELRDSQAAGQVQ
jgi:hypothetical protein